MRRVTSGGRRAVLSFLLDPKKKYTIIHMLTKADLTQLDEKFLTKDEFYAFRDELFTRLDDIVGYMKKSDEEETVLAYQQSSQRDDIDTLKGRVDKIEQILSLT